MFALLFVATSPTGALVRPADSEKSTTTSQAGDSAPPVVMILLDEFPLQSLLNSKGEVDARVFPNFAKLAERSHWYRNATGVSGFTQYAVPAVLSGQYPKAKLAPSYVQHPNNIFSLLAPDYRIRAFETITQLCDPALCDEADQPSGSDRGMSGLFRQTWQVAKKLAKPYDDSAPVSDQFAEESAGTTTKKPKLTIDKAQTQPNWKTLRANQPERFQRFVAGLKPSDEPTMHFLHLLLPHHPWRYLPSGATHPPRLLGGVAGGWGTYAWPMDVNRQSHLLQLAYTDRLLGDVIDRMEKQGIWDDSMVVVTADHGESFIPGTAGRRLTRGPDTEAQVAWVPMFLKEPGQTKGTTSDANWEQVDLLPTMADALHTDVPFKVDGISQLSDSRDRTEKTFYNSPGVRMEFPGAPGFRIVLEGVTDTAGAWLAGSGRSLRHGQPAGLDRQEGVQPDVPRGRRLRCAEPDDRPHLVRARLRRRRPGQRARAGAGDRTAAAVGRAWPRAHCRQRNGGRGVGGLPGDRQALLRRLRERQAVQGREERPEALRDRGRHRSAAAADPDPLNVPT